MNLHLHWFPHILGILFANALLAALGSGVLLLLDAWRRLARWTRPAVALLAGQAAFVAGAPVLLYARLSVSPLIVVPLIAVVLVAGVVVARRRGRPADPRPGGQGWIAGVLAGLPLLLLGLRAAYHPLFQFDTISNWVLKATVIWAGGHRVTGVLDPRLFARPDLHPQSHLEYPIGMNALYAWDLHWMGTLDTRVIHLQLVLILAAAIGTAWALLRPIVPAAPLAVGLAGLVLMPVLVDGILSAYADVPLACLWAIGAIALLRWADEDERYLLALKQDGVFYDIAIYVAVGSVLAFCRRERLLQLAASAGIVALSAVPWRVYSAVHNLSDADINLGLATMRDQTRNLHPTVSGIWQVLGHRGSLLAAPLAAGFAVACLVRCRRGAEAASLLIATALVLAAIVLIYLNAVVNIRPVLIPALSRILLGLIVLSWVLLPALVYGAIRPRESG